MRTRIKIVVPLLLIPALGLAQQNHIDSLRHSLKIARTDSTRFVIFMGLGWGYSETNRDTALFFHNEAFKLAKKYNRPLDESSALAGKGYVLMHLGKYPESLRCLQQALAMEEDQSNERQYWFTFNKYFTPHQVYLSSLANIHHLLGHLMGATNNIDQQIAEYRITKQLATKAKNNYLLSLVDMNLGAVYAGLNRLNSALVLERNAERVMKQVGYKTYLGYVYAQMGDIYLKKGNKDLAIQYFHEAINTDVEQKNYAAAGYCYTDLTDYYLSEKQKDSSLYYAKKTLETLKSMGSKALDQPYENLYKSYKLAGNTDSAYKYQGIALIAKDSSYQATTKSLADFQKLSFEAQIHAQDLEKEKAATQSRIRTYSMLAAIGVLLLLAAIFYRNNRQKQKVNNVLFQQKEEIVQQKEEIESQRDNLEITLSNLKTAQTQLIQAEKMASLGELTAGIAHEIQNPLNFVNNFSEVNAELLAELKQEISAKNYEEVSAIADDIIDNEKKIILHGKRADGIVKSMLQHSQSGSGVKEPTNINARADEYMRLSYHGLRAKDKSFNAEMVAHFDKNLPAVNVIPQDIGRVLLNLFNNAFYAVNQKQKTVGADYKPEVMVTTSTENGRVVIKVNDNGVGIPDAIKEKIMQPFFTTKPTGEGTGLGLSLTYDMVVKGNGGKIEVSTKEGEFTEFIVYLPI